MIPFLSSILFIILYYSQDSFLKTKVGVVLALLIHFLINSLADFNVAFIWIHNTGRGILGIVFLFYAKFIIELITVLFYVLLLLFVYELLGGIYLFMLFIYMICNLVPFFLHVWKNNPLNEHRNVVLLKIEFRIFLGILIFTCLVNTTLVAIDYTWATVILLTTILTHHLSSQRKRTRLVSQRILFSPTKTNS